MQLMRGVTGTFAFLAFTAVPCSLLAQAQGHVRAWYVSPEEVAAQSQLVCLLEITARRTTAPDDGPTPIYTEFQARVIELWKGDAADSISFRQTGGTLGEITTSGEPFPDYRVGQRWVVALVGTHLGWWTTWGIRHGAFRIDGDRALRNYDGFEFIDGTVIPERTESFDLKALRKRLAATPPAVEPAPKSGPAPREVTEEARKASRAEPIDTPQEPPAQDSPWLLGVGLVMILGASWILFRAVKRT